MTKSLRIAVTTGDPDGIGLEVTIKALQQLGTKSRVIFFVFVASEAELKNYSSKARFVYRSQLVHLHKVLNARYKVFYSNSLEDAINQASTAKKPAIWVISSDKNPAIWVEQASRAAKKSLIDGLVTAPLSKTLIQRDGLSDLGHTDILKRVFGIKEAFMSFWGNQFNVSLVTGHIPVSKVGSKLSPRTFKLCLLETRAVCRKLRIKKPIGVLGLNPHAGEGGLIGKEELRLSSVLDGISGVHQELLVPDVAFQKRTIKKFGAFVCLYHDQGLIPFKMAHGQESGAHLTIGLPIIRTSVDHGTAKDIFGKNKATPNSMIDALNLCIKLAKAK